MKNEIAIKATVEYLDAEYDDFDWDNNPPEIYQVIKSALDGYEIIELLPYSHEIRKADRMGKSIIDALSPELLTKFENILKKL